MRYLYFFVAVLLAVSFASAQEPAGADHCRAPMIYELYSWQDKADLTWNFCVLYNTDRQKTVREVFDRKTVLRGLDQLKEKVAGMPKGSRVIWFDRLTIGGVKVKGSENLSYPPQTLIGEVRDFASARGITVVVPQSAPKP